MAKKQPNPAIREAVSVGEFVGAKEERARIRRALAPVLRDLRVISETHGNCGCNICLAVVSIDAATKPTRPARAKERKR